MNADALSSAAEQIVQFCCQRRIAEALELFSPVCSAANDPSHRESVQHIVQVQKTAAFRNGGEAVFYGVFYGSTYGRIAAKPVKVQLGYPPGKYSPPICSGRAMSRSGLKKTKIAPQFLQKFQIFLIQKAKGFVLCNRYPHIQKRFFTFQHNRDRLCFCSNRQHAVEINILLGKAPEDT